MMTDTTFKEDIKLDEKIKKETELPRRYKVIILNDDLTPMEWVISILTEIFKHTQSKAQELTLAIHSDGSAIAGIYSYEIAEQKSVEATMLSRNNGFPLAFKLEVE
jgi:ATP-dependent Clp protease adaptor protein ClpS